MQDFGLNGHKRSPNLICPKFPYSTQIWKSYIILHAFIYVTLYMMPYTSQKSGLETF